LSSSWWKMCSDEELLILAPERQCSRKIYHSALHNFWTLSIV
jgi:hypothetical protein